MSSAVAGVDNEIKIDIEDTREGSAKILLVDDDEPTLELVKRNLNRLRNFKLEIASNPEEALEKVDSTYDCVVSDYDMPEMDGLELLSEIKNRLDLPFILYTGKGSEEIASKAISEGVDNYLRKESGIDHFKMLAKQIDNNISQKQTEEALNRAVKQYRDLLDSSPVPIFLTREGNVIYANEEGMEITQEESLSELKDKNIMDYIVREDQEKIQKVVADIHKGNEPEKIVFRYKKGDEERIAEACSSMIYFEGEPALQTAVRDITTEKRVKDELREKKHQMEGLMKSLPVGVVATNEDDRIGFINSKFLDIFNMEIDTEAVKDLTHEKMIELLCEKAEDPDRFSNVIKEMVVSEDEVVRRKIELEGGSLIEGKLRKVREKERQWNIWVVRTVDC